MATEPKLNIRKRAEFGNPILRELTKPLPKAEILSPKVQKLITDMRATLKTYKLGIGLAAPQVGEGIALSVITIQPTKHRPDVELFELVVINPKIIETYGRRVQLWEGCISSGTGKAGLFAKVPRYKKVKVRFYDQKAKRHEQVFEGLRAHVLQHEIDHLNGVLFVDKVKDTKTYTTYSEYLKLQRKKKKAIA